MRLGVVEIERFPRTWQPLPESAGGVLAMERMAAVFAAWLGTPYGKGMQKRGPRGGVDCLRHVSGLQNDLDREERLPPERLPQDLAMRDPKRAGLVVRQFIRAYDGYVVRDGTAQPGDIGVIAREGEGPGHGITIGPKPNTIWESSGGVGRGCVRMIGWQLDAGATLVRLYRRPDEVRRRWATA